ncbi:MAG TPA: hypothetical protein DEO70_07175 [Bacteroidales bacterium]|nr:MAG: hypothetical protein A2X11_06790 [Bacteroidetes bacterium GWE2_42_24]OFY25985.1 MAG: hypothetical protein A2X09_04805 [Bacteroidetes bacterium GWF2_43_11]HBZ66603.1 hypothetical protein [Bacteroidales bacterium]
MTEDFNRNLSKNQSFLKISNSFINSTELLAARSPFRFNICTKTYLTKQLKCHFKKCETIKVSYYENQKPDSLTTYPA